MYEHTVGKCSYIVITVTVISRGYEIVKSHVSGVRKYRISFLLRRYRCFLFFSFTERVHQTYHHDNNIKHAIIVSYNITTLINFRVGGTPRCAAWRTWTSRKPEGKCATGQWIRSEWIASRFCAETRRAGRPAGGGASFCIIIIYYSGTGNRLLFYHHRMPPSTLKVITIFTYTIFNTQYSSEYLCKYWVRMYTTVQYYVWV